MSTPLILTVVSTLIISLGSLLGAFTLIINKEKLNNLLIFLVALSTGTLMGAAFLHLIPEANETLISKQTSTVVLFAFIVFFLIEKLLKWRHHHSHMSNITTIGTMNLIGDGFHNLLDGLIIAAAFQSDLHLGIATSIAVALHEIPQEIGDFGVLLHSGYSTKKALFSNLLVALTAIIGGIAGFYWVESVKYVQPYIMAFAAGGFIYVSASDLLPEIRHEEQTKRSWMTFIIFLIGISLMLLF